MGTDGGMSSRSTPDPLARPSAISISESVRLSSTLRIVGSPVQRTTEGGVLAGTGGSAIEPQGEELQVAIDGAAQVEAGEAPAGLGGAGGGAR